MPWDPPDIPVDPDEVTARILDGLQTKLPGWSPVEGAPEVALAEEIGRETAVLNAQTIEVLNLAVAGMGETAFGFPAYLGVVATIDVELVVVSVGDVVPQGFTVVGVNDNGDEVAFELAEETTAPAPTFTVTMRAMSPGDFGNTVPAGALTVVVATASVDSATAVTASADGADPETLEDYLFRLVDYLATLRPGGVRASDLAALARSVPGVYRALGVDLYDPANPGVPAERTATVFPIDQFGAPVSPSVATQVQTVLEASREVNFLIYVNEPTYTPVYVAYEAVAETGADPVVVAAGVESAVIDWLAAWGTTPNNVEAWEPINVVRHLELARVAGSAPGVAYLSLLTINGLAADLNLPGVAALPASATDPIDPSTVTGTVT